MKRLTFKALALATCCTAASVARADDLPQAPASMDPSDASNPVALVEGKGVRVGEGTVLHPQFGAETGVVSNVFYSDANTRTSGLLRLIFEIGTASLSPQRLAAPSGNADVATGDNIDKGDFAYAANAYLTWDQYLSTDSDVTAQGGLGGGLLLRGTVNPGKPLQLSGSENFNRLIRATNYESAQDTNRDVNTLGLRLSYFPTGRSLGGYLHFSSVLDLFEQDNQRFADRFQNSLGLRVEYRFLPLTMIYADVTGGISTGIGTSSTKVTSFPLTAVAGIQTALTLNTFVIGRIGYTQGFYEAGPSYATVVGGLQVGYKYSPLGRVTLMYSYEHEDSINANFYRDHLVQLQVEQQFVPFSVYARPELRFREYQGIMAPIQGPPTRDDTIFGMVVGMRYQFRDWIAASAYYRLSIDSTNYRYDVGDGMPMDDPSYVRHELMVGVRAAY